MAGVEGGMEMDESRRFAKIKTPHGFGRAEDLLASEMVVTGIEQPPSRISSDERAPYEGDSGVGIFPVSGLGESDDAVFVREPLRQLSSGPIDSPLLEFNIIRCVQHRSARNARGEVPAVDRPTVFRNEDYAEGGIAEGKEEPFRFPVAVAYDHDLDRRAVRFRGNGIQHPD